jgi:hypothetical protein
MRTFMCKECAKRTCICCSAEDFGAEPNGNELCWCGNETHWMEIDSCENGDVEDEKL